MQTVSNAMRFFFFVVASVTLTGIWLTGFDKVHWLLYAPVLFFYFAAVTGICPGLIIARNLFPEKKAAKSKRRK